MEEKEKKNKSNAGETIIEVEKTPTESQDAESEKVLQETIQKIKETASEEDPRPSQQVNLRTILGGDILTAGMVRSQIWLFVLIVAYTIVYVAFRYQCQQDMQAIGIRYFTTEQGFAAAYCRPASLYNTNTRIGIAS